ncbi:hypothetical protein Ciccas_014412, partial [Cichlidogyrus casuarinus]
MGKKLAVVGPGATAFVSTLVSLLYKEDLADNGEIKFGDKSINSLDSLWLRSQIAVLQEESPLFEASFEENIYLGRTAQQSKELMNLVKLVQLEALVKALPEDFATILDPGASMWDVSHRQRIGLLRALAKQPKLLLLCGATSTLKAELEQQLLQTWTQAIVMTTNRPETMTFVSCIFYVGVDGTFVSGTHTELYASNNTYKNFFDEQVDYASRLKNLSLVPYCRSNYGDNFAEVFHPSNHKSLHKTHTTS